MAILNLGTTRGGPVRFDRKDLAVEDPWRVRPGPFDFLIVHPYRMLVRMKKISVTLPATDEPVSLVQTVEMVKELLPEYILEFIIVTHPKISTPECKQAARDLVQKYPNEVEAFEQTKPGLGGAIQEAFTKCTGDYTVLMSSDLETDPAALPEMMKKMEEGYDIAATTRWQGGVRFNGYDPIKLVLNFCFQQFFRLLYWTKLTDLTYAYRVYRTDIVKRIRWEENGFPFLFETLLKPLRLGYRTAEVKAPWIARTEGASHNSFSQTLKYVHIGLRLRFQPKSKMLYTAAQ